MTNNMKIYVNGLEQGKGPVSTTGFADPFVGLNALDKVQSNFNVFMLFYRIFY